MRRDRLDLLLELGEEAERLLVGVVALRPAAGGRERDDAARPAARRELQREVAAERVADDVRGLDAGLVHRLLERVGEQVARDLAVAERRSAGVADERGREHLVVLLQRGRTRSHVREESMKPWMRTSGVRLKPRSVVSDTVRMRAVLAALVLALLIAVPADAKLRPVGKLKAKATRHDGAADLARPRARARRATRSGARGARRELKRNRTSLHRPQGEARAREYRYTRPRRAAASAARRAPRDGPDGVARR